MNTPETFYFVTANYKGDIGFGGAGDPTPDRNAAYDMFADAAIDGELPTAFMVERKANGAPFITDITEDFTAELRAILKDREIDVEFLDACERGTGFEYQMEEVK
jgi:hypothetical protein